MKCKYIGEIKTPVQVKFNIGDHQHMQTMVGTYAFKTLREAKEFKQSIATDGGEVFISKQ